MLVALLASILLLTAGGTLQRSEEEQDAGGAPETAVEQPEQERAADDQPAQETSLGFEVIPEVVRNIEPSVVAVLRDDGEGGAMARAPVEGGAEDHDLPDLNLSEVAHRNAAERSADAERFRPPRWQGQSLQVIHHGRTVLPNGRQPDPGRQAGRRRT